MDLSDLKKAERERVRSEFEIWKHVKSPHIVELFDCWFDKKHHKVVFITAIYGLGENIVQGVANPDEYLVFKPTMKEISRLLGSKEIAMVYDVGGGRATRNIAVPEALQPYMGGLTHIG